MFNLLRDEFINTLRANDNFVESVYIFLIITKTNDLIPVSFVGWMAKIKYS